MELPTRSSAGVHQTVQAAMLDFYTFLARMPHVQPGAVRHPPAEGWSAINAERLRELGNSEEAIDFVRHLPCLVHEPADSWTQHANITPETQSIYFCNVETIKDWQVQLLSTPSHVIWIGDALTRDGHYLLLDTIAGNIVEVGLISGTTTLKYEAYEALSVSEKWSAHETLPAQAWFAREKRRLERLVYLPVPPSPTSNDHEILYLYRAEGLAQEEDMLAHEALLFDDDHDADYNETLESSSDEVSSSDHTDDDDDDDDDDVIPADEIADLQQECLVELPVMPPAPVSTTVSLSPRPTSVAEIMQKPDNVQVYGIYKRNDWPSVPFDRERCKEELIRWRAEWNAEWRRKSEARAAAHKRDDSEAARKKNERRVAAAALHLQMRQQKREQAQECQS